MYQDIDKKLKEFHNENRVRTFEWGVCDCSRFAAKWVKSFIGKDIEKDMPVYSNEVEAMQVLDDLGYSTQEDSLDNYFTRVTKSQLMRGDIVGHYFDGASYMAIGVYAGESSMFKSPNGVLMLPYKSIDTNLCWRVI